MTEFTRRNVLAGALAAGAAAPFAVPARAAAPPAGKQAAGFYRYKVGDIEVTVVTDGANRFKLPDNWVTNAKKDDVTAALRAAYISTDDTVMVPYNPIVVNTAGKLVLIDTGQGEAAYNNSKGQAGQFLTNLAAAGILQPKPRATRPAQMKSHQGEHRVAAAIPLFTSGNQDPKK